MTEPRQNALRRSGTGAPVPPGDQPGWTAPGSGPARKHPDDGGDA